jgi:hypothetical protein
VWGDSCIYLFYDDYVLQCDIRSKKPEKIFSYKPSDNTPGAGASYLDVDERTIWVSGGSNIDESGVIRPSRNVLLFDTRKFTRPDKMELPIASAFHSMVMDRHRDIIYVMGGFHFPFRPRVPAQPIDEGKVQIFDCATKSWQVTGSTRIVKDAPFTLDLLTNHFCLENMCSMSEDFE